MSDENPSRLIDAKIAGLSDWRGETLARVRALIREADPEVVESVKWRKPTNPAGVPVWEHEGILCTCETYKDKVKLTFARGAALEDPNGLFNSSLEGNTRRAVDIREGEAVDEKALKALIRAAVEVNLSRSAGFGKGSGKASGGPIVKHRIYTMSFASVYPHYIAKAEKKGRTKAEVDEIIGWLTGYGPAELEAELDAGTDFESFFAKAPAMNPARTSITGTVCGVRVEEIEEPLMREIRYLDKLIDELAKGKAMEKILREG